MKKDFSIGFDLGTSQSKVCIQHVDPSNRKFDFFLWTRPDNEPTFFLPSRIYFNNNETFSYGYPDTNFYHKEYRYFKIAAADDEEFRLTSEMDEEEEFIRASEFDPFTPELLCVLYVTYVLFSVKDELKESYSEPSTSLVPDFLKGLVSSKEESEIDYTVQLGIPTEYSKKTNLRRRRKFETIILISSFLQKKYKNRNHFVKAKRSELISQVQEKIEDLKKLTTAKNSEEKFEAELNNNHLSVFPETAAGLTFLVETKQLDLGYYAALDIGAGSSDISYFEVVSGGKFVYLASESSFLASNYFYRKYNGSERLNNKGLVNVEARVRELIATRKWEKDLEYCDQSEHFYSKLSKRLYRLLNEYVYKKFQQNKVSLSQIDGQTCFCYGGGFLIEANNKWDNVLIHDNGTKSITATQTILEKKALGDFIPEEEIITAEDWKSIFNFLVVSFGLSIRHYKDQSIWEDKHIDPQTPRLVAHPVNEDLYVYDVIARKW